MPHNSDKPMPRNIRCSLIQASNAAAVDLPLEKVKQAMIDKHLGCISQAAKAGAQIVCLQEIFYGPYFCAEQQTRWYDFTELVPDGPTIRLMQEQARKHRLAMIVPIYERERSRRNLPGKIPQDSHSPCGSRVLGEILFSPRQPGISGV
jgi:predicted amidohydrolase